MAWECQRIILQSCLNQNLTPLEKLEIFNVRGDTTQQIFNQVLDINIIISYYKLIFYLYKFIFRVNSYFRSIHMCDALTEARKETTDIEFGFGTEQYEDSIPETSLEKAKKETPQKKLI